MNFINLYSLLWLCILVLLSFSSKAQVDCSTTTVGLCDEVVDQVIIETVTETIEIKPDGILTTTTTEKDITTTTVENKDSGDILDGDNGYVTSSKEGDMDIDWGGQGPATGCQWWAKGRPRVGQWSAKGCQGSAMGCKWLAKGC